MYNIDLMGGFINNFFLYLYELVSVVPRIHYINHLTVLGLHLLCNLEAVSVTKIGLQIRAEDALHIIKCEI